MEKITELATHNITYCNCTLGEEEGKIISRMKKETQSHKREILELRRSRGWMITITKMMMKTMTKTM
jgi:hypothetical protein